MYSQAVQITETNKTERQFIITNKFLNAFSHKFKNLCNTFYF